MVNENLGDLTIWVLGVDRRLIVLKIICEKGLTKGSDIAYETGRSLQNINYAIRELEDQELIRCIAPEKHTWKKFIPTEKGINIFQEIKDNRFID